VKEGAPYILLSPWASAQARTFPAGRFGDAALRLAKAVEKQVVVTGTAQHRPLSNGLMRTLGTWGIDLVGATSARELAVLTKDAALVLTNNTLTLHFADAFRTPAVILYAGTDLESQWRPRVTRHRLLNRSTACTPCYCFVCPASQECLDVPTDEIVAAGLELLGG
jgi:ADP-heptose:LPS heptosyltransferase